MFVELLIPYKQVKYRLSILVALMRWYRGLHSGVPSGGVFFKRIEITHYGK